jgi:hypothetical protein
MGHLLAARIFLFVTELQPSTFDLVQDLIFGLGFEVEKIGEKIEMRLYS